jgi:osmotically-inducible protein OsmY
LFLTERRGSFVTQSVALVEVPSRKLDELEKASQEAAARAVQCLEDLGLAERVARALRTTGYPSLRAVRVLVRGQLVSLHGRVPSYHMKQLAQAVAMEVAGGREVRNDVEVTRPA